MDVFVIDDDKLLLNSLQKNLELIGNTVAVCDSGKDALTLMESHAPDVVLLDIKLGDMSGIDLLKEIKKQSPGLPVVMITAFTDVQTVVTAMKSGAEDYISKPIDLNDLEIVLERAKNSIRKDRKITVLEQDLAEEKGSILKTFKSTAMRKILQFVNKVAKSPDTSVLIEGESGTGKEVIARMIHDKSPRSGAPYITINCGALPKDLIENELFGSEKGAFTGALNKTKKGKFELADGGSILLDEIGELSPEAQVKLLRVLQERRFFRVGGSHEIAVDIRIIATTNKNLEEQTAKGAFREDLFYRLNVARIVIPPLRSRKSDIIPLANLFIAEFEKKFQKGPIALAKPTETFLENYFWKGNVRELRNAIERVVLFEAEETIEPGHFHFISPAGMVDKAETGSGFAIKIPAKGVSMAEATRKLIEETLDLTKGNKVLAAKLLGITRGKLLYRIKQLDIDR